MTIIQLAIITHKYYLDWKFCYFWIIGKFHWFYSMKYWRIWWHKYTFCQNKFFSLAGVWTFLGLGVCMFFWPHLPSPGFLWFRSCAAKLHLKFPAFKGVTCRCAIKTHIPAPLPPQVHEGATGRLEPTSNLGILNLGTPIWSPQSAGVSTLIAGSASQKCCQMIILARLLI